MLIIGDYFLEWKQDNLVGYFQKWRFNCETLLEVVEGQREHTKPAVNTVPADDLVLPGSRTSADAVITKFNSSVRDRHLNCEKYNSRLIQGLRPANERRRYKVTPSLIGWAHT